MKLTKAILNESNPDQNREKIETNLKDITYAMISGLFGKKMFGHNVPNPDDSSTSVHSEEALNRWKSGIGEKYGNVDITMDNTGGVAWYDQIKINNDQFINDKRSYTDSKASWLSGERQAGRSSGLD
tara:strand:- start:1766 stop:2146 length:381 start_codon:yes stop_codon:yes gene_type:complete